MGHEYKFILLAADGQEVFQLVETLGQGVQGTAQLVCHERTDQLLVRKVLRPPVDARPTNGPPSEVQALNYLKTFRPATYSEPRVIDCLFSEDIPFWSDEQEVRGTESKKQRQYARVSYWKLCDGGTFAGLFSKHSLTFVTAPYAVTFRCIWQLCESVHFLHRAGPAPVHHNDLHTHNIFVHWRGDADLPDFYLGDFGYAEIAPAVISEFAVPNDIIRIHDVFDMLLSAVANGGDHHHHHRHYQILRNIAKKRWLFDFAYVIRQARAAEALCLGGGGG